MKVQHRLLFVCSHFREKTIYFDSQRRRKGSLTIRISYLALVLESSSYSNAENQKDPVDVRDVNLPKEFLRGVDYLHAGEATKCKSLLYD